MKSSCFGPATGFHSCAAFSAAAIALVTVSAASAQETFLYQGGGGIQVWEDADNWIPEMGDFSTWPGEAPESGTLDSADLSAPLGSNLDISIATPGLRLNTLEVGASDWFYTTTISGTGDGTLTANTIRSTGFASAVTNIDIDFLMPDGNLTIDPGQPPVRFTGRFVNDSPQSGTVRTIHNDGGGTLFFSGELMLSNDSDNAGQISIINDPVSTVTVTGLISDGAAPGGSIRFARGNNTITGSNTHSGRTIIGENHPDSTTNVIISKDDAFGTSRIVITGGTALKTIRPTFGSGPKTLANDLQLSRDLAFTGAEDFTLNGTVWQSSGRQLINNLSPSRTLTINGDIYASDSTDVREWVFAGTGTTVVNGIIDDSLGFPTVTGATMRKTGSGRTILTNPDVAAYTGGTTVAAGVLQLGDGGTGVKLNGNTIGGSARLELNHSDTLTFDSLITSSVTVFHTGPGTTTLTEDNTSSGDLTVEQGTVQFAGSWSEGEVTVEDAATIAGDGTISGRLEVDSGGTVSPGFAAGGSATGALNVGSLGMDSDSTLAIEIGGTDPGDYDQLLVASAAALNGNLVVHLVDLFTPDTSAEFTILTAGTLSGSFENVVSGARVSTLGGEGSFLLTSDAPNHVVTLSDFQSDATFTADFDNDGDVDTDDLAAWQTAFGQSADADADDDGDTDGADFLSWQREFTGSLPPAEATAVPEPSTWILAAFVATLLPVRRFSR